jgi:hypothetical protein
MKIDSALCRIARSQFFLLDNAKLQILFYCHGVGKITYAQYFERPLILVFAKIFVSIFVLRKNFRIYFRFRENFCINFCENFHYFHEVFSRKEKQNLGENTQTIIFVSTLALGPSIDYP